LEVDDAWKIAARYPRTDVLLGGERGGLPIAGFDLGNSPVEYTPQRVGGRTVVFTTTNGTKAMQQCGDADRVVVGAFVNLSAVCRQVARALDSGRTAHLLCAGTRGEITGEDVLFAGALVWQIERTTAEGNQPSGDRALSDPARLAAMAWTAVRADLQDGCAGELPGAVSAAKLGDYLARSTRGGRNLTALGLGADVVDAVTIDYSDIVPELRLQEWQIVGPSREG
jgi:2-phosphosulfolactate phosphatase